MLWRQKQVVYDKQVEHHLYPLDKTKEYEPEFGWSSLVYKHQA